MTKRDELAELTKQAALLSARIKELEQGIFAEKHATSVGERIEYDGSVYMITSFACYWPRGRKLLKDGTYSKRETNLYRFTKG